MARRIPGDLEQGLEDIMDHIFKVLDSLGSFVNVVESWNLDQPADVVGEELVFDHPVG